MKPLYIRSYVSSLFGHLKWFFSDLCWVNLFAFCSFSERKNNAASLIALSFTARLIFMGCIQIQGLSWGEGGGGQWNLSLILNIITDNFSQLEMCTCVTLGTVGSNQEDSQELIGSLQTKTGEWYFFSVFKILVQLFMYSYWVSNPPAPSPLSLLVLF